MQTGQGNTGVPNTLYDLVSVMYHALEGGQTYSQYISDAQQSGDQELAQFFQQVQQEDSRRAQLAMQFLAQRAGQSGSSWGSMGQSGRGQTSTR
jgi:hypothetical protein